MITVPVREDAIERNGSYWKVLGRRFVFDTEEGDYVKVYIEPYKL